MRLRLPRGRVKMAPRNGADARRPERDEAAPPGPRRLAFRTPISPPPSNRGISAPRRPRHRGRCCVRISAASSRRCSTEKRRVGREGGDAKNVRAQRARHAGRGKSGPACRAGLCYAADSVAEAMGQSAHTDFRPGVGALDPPHDRASLLRREYVHDLSPFMDQTTRSAGAPDELFHA
jgi:hypothetical protein